MGKRYEHPDFEGAYIVLPDRWDGDHAQKYDAVRQQLRLSGVIGTMLDLGCAIAIVEDWGNIPGITKDPEQWDHKKMELPLLAWIRELVLGEYIKAQRVPKNALTPSLNGQAAPVATATESMDGS